jgi:hypothetical protein
MPFDVAIVFAMVMITTSVVALAALAAKRHQAAKGDELKQS